MVEVVVRPARFRHVVGAHVHVRVVAPLAATFSWLVEAPLADVARSYRSRSGAPLFHPGRG